MISSSCKGRRHRVLTAVLLFDQQVAVKSLRSHSEFELWEFYIIHRSFIKLSGLLEK